MSEIQKFKTRIDMIASLPTGSRIVEVGVHKAYFSCEMLNLPNLGHLHLVDAWRPQPAYNDPLTETDHEANLAESKRVLRGHIPGGRVTFVRMDSLKAAKFYKNGPIDFDGAYIDANHSYDAVLADLWAWSECLKPDAWLMGHDWTDNSMSQKYGWGVKKAVKQFCSETDWKIKYITDEDFASFGLVMERASK